MRTNGVSRNEHLPKVNERFIQNVGWGRFVVPTSDEEYVDELALAAQFVVSACPFLEGTNSILLVS